MIIFRFDPDSDCEVQQAATATTATIATNEAGGPTSVAIVATVAVADPKTAGTDARPDLPGISTEFAARLSPEDLDDIAAGDIPLGTVQAFEQAAIAREAEDLREFFEEHAGILESDASMLRPEAELKAARKGRRVVRQGTFTGAQEVKGRER